MAQLPHRLAPALLRGSFCIPFVIWHSIIASIFLFKSQIERWLDRPYDDNLSIAGPRATAEAQVTAALVAVPGSNLHYYELRHRLSLQSESSGVSSRKVSDLRHLQTLQIVNVISEDKPPLKIVSRTDITNASYLGTAATGTVTKTDTYYNPNGTVFSQVVTPGRPPAFLARYSIPTAIRDMCESGL